MTVSPTTSPQSPTVPEGAVLARAEHLTVAEQLWTALYRLAISPLTRYSASSPPPGHPQYGQTEVTPYGHVQAALMAALGELTPTPYLAEKVRDVLGDCDTVADALLHCGLHPDKPGAYRYTPIDTLTFSDTREFLTAADDRLSIIVQIAICRDDATGETTLGRATYYIDCTDPTDPLFSLRSYERVCTEITPDQLPADIKAITADEQDIERLLAAVDPTAFTWTGRDPDITPTRRDAWIDAHWPEDLITRWDERDDED